MNLIYSCNVKAEFSASVFSVTCWFAAQEACIIIIIIIINVENGCFAQ